MIFNLLVPFLYTGLLKTLSVYICIICSFLVGSRDGFLYKHHTHQNHKTHLTKNLRCIITDVSISELNLLVSTVKDSFGNWFSDLKKFGSKESILPLC